MTSKYYHHSDTIGWGHSDHNIIVTSITSATALGDAQSVKTIKTMNYERLKDLMNANVTAVPVEHTNPSVQYAILSNTLVNAIDKSMTCKQIYEKTRKNC